MHDSQSPYGFVLSPDGRFAYSASYGNNQVLIFDRDLNTGALTQKAGTAGCVRGAVATATCASARFLMSPQGIAIAPTDGRTLYVASPGGNTILVFDRDPGTGEIVQKPDDAGCIADSNVQCRDARSLASPYNIAVSPDGRNLYSASYLGNSVTAMNIGGDGTLSQTTDGATGSGCIANAATADCIAGRALAGPYYLTVSPDNGTVYVGGHTDASVVALQRDPATGRIKPIAGVQGCVDREATASCASLPELGSVRYLLVNSQGTRIYAATQSGNVVVLTRLADGRIARLAGTSGCIAGAATTNCATVRALSSGNGVAISPDGEHAYVAGGSGLAEYAIGPDGGLTARPGATACTATAALANCATGTAMASVYGVAVSPDGRFIYTSDTGNSNLQVFRRDSSGPSCATTTITVSAGSVAPLPFPCTDIDGDPFDVSIVNPPTLGSLGAIDNAAHTIVYAAPQGQNGTTTLTFKAAYPGGAFQSGEGSITINVVGAAPPGGGGVVLPSGIDSDKDGFFAGQDCNDANSAIRPGALEVRGNNLDENCDGLAEPFPTLTAGVGNKWSVTGTKFTLTLLQVTQQFPKGWKVKIQCKGSKCPFKSKSLKPGKVKKGASTIITSLSKKQRKFRAGQTVEVWVSAPSFNTKVARFVLRKGKIPTTEPFCVVPGQTKPQKTCS
jgi:DNA-binding beta-propeller fold protein YncE